jgi:hypothetical protein
MSITIDKFKESINKISFQTDSFFIIIHTFILMILIMAVIGEQNWFKLVTPKFQKD